MRRNYLPPELIEAIMGRLPAKSLCRFKSVSKTWCSLISDPKFIKNQLHLNNHHIATKLLLVSDTGFLYTVDINKIRDNISVTAEEATIPPYSIKWDQIVGSCNGLVLTMDRYRTMYLMNPTIREVLELRFGPYLLGESNGLDDIWGFSYDSSIDNYKIIQISLWKNHNPDFTNISVTVFDFKSNSVRQLPNPPYDIVYIDPSNGGVLINGNLHWLIDTRQSYSSTVIAFSLTTEDFTEIEIPHSFDNNKEDGDFTEFELPDLFENKEYVYYNQVVDIGGKLGLFSNNGDLWVMEEYGVGKSWTKISMHGVETIPVCSVDGNTRNIVYGDKDQVGIYNVDERACKDVRILGCPNGFDIGGTYVESLVSPRCITKTV